MPLPGMEARQRLLETLLPEGVAQRLDYQELAGGLGEFSGSDIKLVCKEAAMKPLRRLMATLEDMDEDCTMNWHIPAAPESLPALGPVTQGDFTEAVRTTKKSSQISPARYDEWFAQYGSI